MRIFQSLQDYPETQSAVMSIGFFDGFHLGHRKIIDLMKLFSKKLKAPSVVFTFQNHPLTVLRPSQAPPLIAPPAFKEEFLSGQGVDDLIWAPFTRPFSELEHTEFLDRIHEKFQKLTLILGSNFKFGKNNRGNIETLQEYGALHPDFKVIPVDQVCLDGDRISSTRLRELIGQGNMAQVSRFLNRDFFVEGPVIEGNHLGSRMGFPTANVGLPGYQAVPKLGAYAGKTEVNGVEYAALIYVGQKKLGQNLSKPLIEACLLNFSEMIYQKTIRISFSRFIREPITFNHQQDLKRQLEKDRQTALKIFQEQEFSF